MGLCQAAAAVLAGCLGVMTVADGLASDSWEVRSQLVAGWWEQQEGHLGRRKKKHRGTRLPGVTKQIWKGVCVAHGDPVEGVNI